MRAKLHLVKSSRDSYQEEREVREIRYRYPAEEEAWEVSCDGMEEKGRPAPTLRNKAS